MIKKKVATGHKQMERSLLGCKYDHKLGVGCSADGEEGQPLIRGCVIEQDKTASEGQSSAPTLRVNEYVDAWLLKCRKIQSQIQNPSSVTLSCFHIVIKVSKYF